MDTKLFGPKRKNVNLGGTAGQQQGTINEARQARERRERARLEAQAAVTLQSAYRGLRSRNNIKNANSEAFDQTTLSTENLVIATQLLLGGQPDLSRYASWCRFVVSSKSIFAPFQEHEQQWTILLQRVSNQLMQLAGKHPAAPQATLFLEVVRMMLGSKKYPELFKGAVHRIAVHLVSQGLYRQLSIHIKAIDLDISAKAPSIPSAVNLSLSPLPQFDHLPSEFITFLSIPLLTARLPPNSLKTLSNNFPLHKFLQYFAGTDATLDQASAADLLVNCVPFISPHLGQLKWDGIQGYLSFLQACFKALPSSFFARATAAAPADAMDVDEPPIKHTLSLLVSPNHLNAILAASRSSSSSRPALAQFACSILPHLPPRQTEDFLTVFAFSPSAGAGLVRELFRMLRTYPIFKLGASKELWKEVGRSLTDRGQNESWGLLLLLILVYTRMLRSMGDDAFYPAQMDSATSAGADRNPLQLEEVRNLAELSRNIAFALYWAPPDRARIGRMGIESVRDAFRKFTAALHERDSRRRFLPADLFTMTSAGAFDVATFIESALEEDQRVEDEQQQSVSVAQPAANRTDSDEEEEEQPQPRRLQKGKFSRRQLSIISPRLGLLNSLPFIIPFETRVSIFRHFIAADYARLPRTDPMREFMGGRQVLNVRRGHVAEDGFKLNNLGGEGLKRRLAIQFYDQFDQLEAGIDGGGLFKEFLTDLCKEAFDVNRGLWLTNSRLELYPAPTAYAKEPSSLQWYNFLGKIIGKAMYEGILVSVPFAGFFFSKWLGKQSFLDDLASLDPELYSGLVQLKNYKGDVSELSLSFAVDEEDMGVSRTVDLMPNGRDVPVTNENRNAYIARVCHYHLNLRIRDQCAAFVSGLQEIINPRWLRLFSVSELRVLVEGTDQPVDVDDLRANTVYAGMDESSPAISYLWSVLAEMNAQERKAFLRFVTSADKAPLLGFRELNPRFAIRDAGGDLTRLPSASTCVNMLKLPQYPSKAVLKQKLLMAITAQAGFDLS